MKLSHFQQSLDALRRERRTAQTAAAIFLAVSLILTVMLITRDPVIAVVPFTLQERAQVFSSQATQNYKEAWAMAIALLIGNVQPANVGFIAERIKPLLAPSIYHQTVDAMHANAEQLRAERVAMRFEPRQVIYEPATEKLFVYGYSYTRLGTSLETEERSDRTYEMTLAIDHYAPVITHLTTYTGAPLTREVLERAERDERFAVNRARQEASRNGLILNPAVNDAI